MKHTAVLPALAGVLLLVACDAGEELGPPSALTPGPVPASLQVGATMHDVSVTVVDGDGRALRGASVLWAADGDGSVQPVESVTDDEGTAATDWTLGTAAGPQSLTATVAGLTTTITVDAVPGPLASLTLTDPGRTLTAVGDTLHVTFRAEDAWGNPVKGPPLAWTSLEPAVATVAGGVVTSAGDGTARIVALAGARADTALVAVDRVVTGLAVKPASPILARDEDLQLTAEPVDANGFAVDTSVSVTWATSAPAIASVDGDGRVHAIQAGTATLAATAGSLVGEATVEVRQGPRPLITSIEPAVVVPGETVTLTGSGFGASVEANTVSVGGLAATVLTASATQLTARVETGSLPCAPTGKVAVVVGVDGLEATAMHPLAVAPRLELGVGESVTLTGAGARCSELDQPGEYIISVFNATNSAAATASFRLRGTGPGPAAVTAAGRPLPPSPRPTLRSRPEALAHAEILDANLERLRRLGRPEGVQPRASLRSEAAGAAAASEPTPGEILSLRIPDIDQSNACVSYRPVGARVVHVGRHAIVLEDTLAPLAGQTDDLWAEVGQEYDDRMHQILLDNVGDPLVLDSQLDGNGRLMMLFSEEVNEFRGGGLAGFVFSGDFYTRTQCGSSDRGEIFYGIVPTSAVSGYGEGTVDRWRWTMRSTVFHEVKHIASFASRIAGATAPQPSFEANWLEESTARLAEELYARSHYGYGPGENTGYEESVGCEVDPFGCGGGRPVVLWSHFLGLAEYYAANEVRTPLGSIGAGDASYYGSGWLFVRWAIDQSGQDEAAFIRALVGEPSLTGVANLAARTGRSHADMLADFSLAMAADDLAGFVPARQALSIAGWNTRDVFAGLHGDYGDDPDLGQYFPLSFPLALRPLTFGSFDREVRIRGGTASLFELTGTLSDTQLIELLSPSGGSAAPALGLAILRVR